MLDHLMRVEKIRGPVCTLREVAPLPRLWADDLCPFEQFLVIVPLSTLSNWKREVSNILCSLHLIPCSLESNCSVFRVLALCFPKSLPLLSVVAVSHVLFVCLSAVGAVDGYELPDLSRPEGRPKEVNMNEHALHVRNVARVLLRFHLVAVFAVD